MMTDDGFARAHVMSADGTRIAHEVTGSGPGLVIVHGVARMARNYRDLARALAGSFTVHLLERRGRGGSGPKGDGYRMERECEDLRAVLAAAGASLLFGHSYGGLVALETAIDTPLEKLAVYEPGVSVRGSLPTGWLPEFEAALERNGHAEAMAIMIKSLGMVPQLRRVPLWALRSFIRLLSTRGGQEWEGTVECLPTLPSEVREVRRLDSTAERYRAVACDTLLMMGEASPAYMREPVQDLAVILPRAELLTLAKLGHNAPDLQAPARIAEELRGFFLGGGLGDGG